MEKKEVIKRTYNENNKDKSTKSEVKKNSSSEVKKEIKKNMNSNTLEKESYEKKESKDKSIRNESKLDQGDIKEILEKPKSISNEKNLSKVKEFKLKNNDSMLNKNNKIKELENKTEALRSKTSKKDKATIQEKRQITKVTDFDDVKKAALANEKKKKKLEQKEQLKETIETLKTPKARTITTVVFVTVLFLIFVAMTIINEVQIDEGKHYTERQIKELVIKNIFDYNSVYLFLKYRYSEQEEIPFVEYIDVDWINKNTVKLKVYDKNIIGCTNFMNEYIYFDKDGFVVETSSKKEKDIPYITGIDFEGLTLNSRIKVDDEDIFEIILTITQQISKYKLDIDEIKFDKDNSLTMYAGNVTVLLGKQETYDEQLAKLKSMLEKAKKENLSGVLHMEKYKEGQERIIFDKNN